MPTIRATITMTVFLQAESPAAAIAILASLEPSQIVAEMDDGEFVGSLEITGAEGVSGADLRGALAAIGASGDFFEEGGEEDPEEPTP